MKKNTKKFIFATVPIGTPHFPEMAIPSLVAQLKNNNYDVGVMDLNIDFLHYIYNKHYLKASIEKAKKQYEELKLKKEEFYNSQETREKCKLSKKFDNLDDFFSNYKELAEKVPESIDKALQILNTEKLFYNPKLLQYAHRVVKYAEKISCLQYNLFDFYETFADSYEDLCKIIFDKEQNIFIEYFEQKLDEIKTLNPDYIGISISYRQQLIAGLTFASVLKKNTNVYVNIGGDYISRLTEYIPNYKDFFDIFADSISFGEGECSILKLAKYIKGEIDINDVPQLIYKDDKTQEIRVNKSVEKVLLTKIHRPDYSDYDLERYFLPERVLPLRIQKGCYWNKCSFCAFPYAKTSSVKTIENVIDEIKYYVETYNTRIFMILDVAMHPILIEKFADEIIKNKLDVRFYVHLKLEKEFSYRLLKKLYKAGFSNMWWGLESANERVQNLMNKGVDLKYVPSILKNADKVGIFNALYLMCGFPTATYEEDKDTYNFLRKYSNLIHYFLISRFVPVRYSPVYNEAENYKIKIKEENLKTRVALDLEYEKQAGMTKEKTLEVYNEFSQYYYNDKYKYIFAPYYYIMYSNKYGLNYVKENLLKIDKKEKNIRRFFNKIFNK